MWIFTALRRLFGGKSETPAEAGSLTQSSRNLALSAVPLEQLKRQDAANVHPAYPELAMQARIEELRLNHEYRKLEHERRRVTAPQRPEDAAARQRSSSDDGFDGLGFAMGAATGVPIGPRGVTGGSVLGAALHSSSAHSHSSSDSSSSSCSSGGFDSGSSSCSSGGGID